MKLSVIVTHHKTPELLELCLRSIKEACQGMEHEILVLDSEGQEETAEAVKSAWPGIKYFAFKKNIGYAKLVNAGLHQARGDYYLVINADIVAVKTSLKIMTEYLEANPRVGMLAPQLLNFNGTVQESYFRFHRFSTVVYRRTVLGKSQAGKKELARFAMKDFTGQGAFEVDWALGAAMLIRQAALREVGLMDERFFMYFEDTDWCRRFWEKGWRVVYLPEAKMHHYHGRSSKKTGGLADLLLNRYTWIHIVSAAKYFWKWRGRPLAKRSADLI